MAAMLEELRGILSAETEAEPENEETQQQQESEMTASETADQEAVSEASAETETETAGGSAQTADSSRQENRAGQEALQPAVDTSEQNNKEDIWEDSSEEIPSEEVPDASEDASDTPGITVSGSDIAGSLIGVVAEAADHMNYISGVRIEAYDRETMELIQTMYTDDNGAYQMVLCAGDYALSIFKDGYLTISDIVNVTEGQRYMEPYLLVAGTADETGNVSGYITNAMTGAGVQGVLLTARSGWNNMDGNVVASTYTEADGHYSMQLPFGNYTIMMEEAGFVTNHFNVAVGQQSIENANGVVNPVGGTSFPEGDMRVVLTWGETPRDLDSHLIGPIADGEDSFHIYYGEKSYEVNGSVAAFLDVDDTTSYGPETTTVYQMNDSGIYSFYVHDYTNRWNDSSMQLSNSGAQVTVDRKSVV